MMTAYLVEHGYDFGDADEAAVFRTGAEVMLASVHPVRVTDYNDQHCVQWFTLSDYSRQPCV